MTSPYGVCVAEMKGGLVRLLLRCTMYHNQVSPPYGLSVRFCSILPSDHVEYLICEHWQK